MKLTRYRLTVRWPLLTPPRPVYPAFHDDDLLDPEALIREARRRARRRRAAYTGIALVGLTAAFAAFSAFGGGGSKGPPVGEKARPPDRLATAATIMGTLPLSARETVLFSARAGSVYALIVSPDHAPSVTVARLGAEGAASTNRVAFDQPTYLMDLSAGRDGLYAGTAVVKRFTSQPDELVRIDARTLTVRARATFGASVATIEQGPGMWASLGDGRVARLDPRTLAVVASRRLLSPDLAASGASILSKPAVGLGSVWVLAGSASDRELVRIDPTTLAIRSKTRVPSRGGLAQAFTQVAADAGHVYLVGRAVVPVDRAGKLAARPVLVPGLATAAIRSGGLVGLTNGSPGIVLLDAKGRTVARTGVVDAGANLAVSGDDAWFLGNAGRGNGLVHVRLANG